MLARFKEQVATRNNPWHIDIMARSSGTNMCLSCKGNPGFGIPLTEESFQSPQTP